MDDFANNFKNTILLDLYKSPQKKRIQQDIFDILNIPLHPTQLISYRKQLVAEGLIREENPDEDDSPIEVTSKGYKAIQLYGSYMNYIKVQKNDALLSRESQKMQQKYLKLKYVCSIITIILSILSFIAGILLSDRIQNIL
ncbi:hypothetical protein [Bacteroides sp. UBA939]|uniref:hypothetical protein n=1 Tax=Bacteroides sp. UBA939 TaxID=1946092 RepID=UPI0025C09769|nr:hypothetical protein [Bacteroides sp. UBA939]